LILKRLKNKTATGTPSSETDIIENHLPAGQVTWSFKAFLPSVFRVTPDVKCDSKWFSEEN
jgi:hypothetical protein